MEPVPLAQCPGKRGRGRGFSVMVRKEDKHSVRNYEIRDPKHVKCRLVRCIPMPHSHATESGVPISSPSCWASYTFYTSLVHVRATPSRGKGVVQVQGYARTSAVWLKNAYSVSEREKSMSNNYTSDFLPVTITNSTYSALAFCKSSHLLITSCKCFRHAVCLYSC